MMAPHRIELDSGIVTSATIFDVSGESSDFASIGHRHFYVDLVEHDGGRIALWCGTDYGQAIRSAEIARLDFEVEAPVRDLIAGGRA